MKKLLICLTTATLLSGSLSGCAVALLGGALAGGLSIADRRTTGAQTDDEMMELRVVAQVNKYLAERYAQQHLRGISAVSYNRSIVLLGAVPQEADRQYAERAAKAQTPARHVYNYITVNANQESVAQSISQDTWITSKIRTALLAPHGFSPNRIKVVTYAGVTYVLGLTTAAEQNAAAAQISTVSGVQKVVTLFETINP